MKRSSWVVASVAICAAFILPIAGAQFTPEDPLAIKDCLPKKVPGDGAFFKAL